MTGASYIGSAVDLTKRLRQYYSPGYLKKEVLKTRSIVYRALLKYGYPNFSLDILEHCDVDSLIEREQYYLDKLQPTYNICKTAGSSFGRVTTTETRRRLRAARLLREFRRVNQREETMLEYSLGKIEQRLENLESRLSRILTTLEKLQADRQSKISLATRAKILASSSSAQAVCVTDLTTSFGGNYYISFSRSSSSGSQCK